MELSQLTVDEFTTPSPLAVQLNTPLPEVWELMQSKGVRHILVKDADKNSIRGVLSERDLTTFSQSENFNRIEAQEIMSEDLLTVSPETKLFEVALKMSEKKCGSAIIHDTENNFVGIFTATDALNALVEVLRGDLDL